MIVRFYFVQFDSYLVIVNIRIFSICCLELLSSFFCGITYSFIGGYVIRIGDYVTRKSYQNDIVFRVIDVQRDNFILCGASIRLLADSPKSDLVKYNEDVDEDDDFGEEFCCYKTLDRSEYFYLPGKVLHIDGDQEFLDKCMNFYKKNKIKAYGVYSLESELADNIQGFLDKYNPDILDKHRIAD